jgi:hypothetical protein
VIGIIDLEIGFMSRVSVDAKRGANCDHQDVFWILVPETTKYDAKND